MIWCNLQPDCTDFFVLGEVIHSLFNPWGKLGGNGLSVRRWRVVVSCCCKVQQLLGDVGGIHVAAAERVGVDAQRGACVSVSHAGRDGNGINGVCKQNGGVRVPLRYNYDKPEKPRRIKGFEVFSLVFSSFSKPKNHTEISRIIGGVSLTTNE